MSSEDTASFVVYNLRTSFSEEPTELNGCLVCKDLLLKFNIPPSKTIVDQILHYSGFHFDYSHLYECPSCQWWAIRESWLDIGANGSYDFLIAGEKGSAWTQILENRDVYFKTTTMPDTIKRLFTQKDINNHFVTGDQVRLCTNFVVRQPLGTFSPLCIQGSQGIIVRKNEYTTQYAQQLKNWKVSENILLDDIIKRAMLDEAHREVESGNYYAVRLKHVVLSETTEKFGVCKVDDVHLLSASNLEKA